MSRIILKLVLRGQNDTETQLREELEALSQAHAGFRVLEELGWELLRGAQAHSHAVVLVLRILLKDGCLLLDGCPPAGFQVILVQRSCALSQPACPAPHRVFSAHESLIYISFVMYREERP